MERSSLEGLLFINSRIQKEEDAVGFLCRTLDYRFAGSREQLLHFLGSTSGRVAWAFPSRLEEVTNHLQTRLPPFPQFMNLHTRYPLAAPFLSEEDRNRLHGHLQGLARPGASALVGVTKFVHRGRLAMCMECVRNDLISLGFAFWRRAHLVPGASYCAAHQSPLFTYCASCELGHRRFNRALEPALVCLCNRSLQPLRRPQYAKTEKALIAIETMAGELLRGETSVILEHGLVPTYARTRVMRNGIEGRAGALGEATELLNENIGPEGLRILGISRQSIRRLLGAKDEHGFVRNALANIAMVYAVFGSWAELDAEVGLRTRDIEAYERSCRRIHKRVRADVRLLPLKQRVTHYRRLSKEEFRSARVAARACITDALRVEPALTRGGLRKFPRGSEHYTFALHLDTTWFDKVLPAKRARRPRATNESWHARRGEELVTHIYQQHERLVRDKPSCFITRAALLNNSACESIPGYAERFEGVSEALADCVDTEESYHRRRIDFLCDAINACGLPTHYGDRLTYDGLTFQQLKSRLWRARKWLRKHKDE